LARSPHILLVDDDHQIRTGLGRFLASQGLRVSQAKDGNEMFDAFSTGHIDLIVLDVMLPGADGVSLCRKLRTTSDVPVLLLTPFRGRPTASWVSRSAPTTTSASLSAARAAGPHPCHPAPRQQHAAGSAHR
jgi:CheY-like chemotaxis protein